MKARRVKHLDPGASLRDNLARIIRVRLDEVYTLAPVALEPGQVQAQHDLRIAAKRLRYLLEVGGFCFGSYAQTAARRCREVQDLLGELHDCDVLAPRVAQQLDEMRGADIEAVRAAAGQADDLDPALAAALPHGDAYRGLEALDVWARARRELLFRRFQVLWESLDRHDFRSRLEQALLEPPVEMADGRGDAGAAVEAADGREDAGPAIEAADGREEAQAAGQAADGREDAPAVPAGATPQPDAEATPAGADGGSPAGERAQPAPDQRDDASHDGDSTAAEPRPRARRRTSSRGRREPGA